MTIVREFDIYSLLNAYTLPGFSYSYSISLIFPTTLYLIPYSIKWLPLDSALPTAYEVASLLFPLTSSVTLVSII